VDEALPGCQRMQRPLLDAASRVFFVGTFISLGLTFFGLYRTWNAYKMTYQLLDKHGPAAFRFPLRKADSVRLLATMVAYNAVGALIVSLICMLLGACIACLADSEGFPPALFLRRLIAQAIIALICEATYVRPFVIPFFQRKEWGAALFVIELWYLSIGLLKGIARTLTLMLITILSSFSPQMCMFPDGMESWDSAHASFVCYVMERVHYDRQRREDKRAFRRMVVATYHNLHNKPKPQASGAMQATLGDILKVWVHAKRLVSVRMSGRASSLSGRDSIARTASDGVSGRTDVSSSDYSVSWTRPAKSPNSRYAYGGVRNIIMGRKKDGSPAAASLAAAPPLRLCRSCFRPRVSSMQAAAPVGAERSSTNRNGSAADLTACRRTCTEGSSESQDTDSFSKTKPKRQSFLGRLSLRKQGSKRASARASACATGSGENRLAVSAPAPVPPLEYAGAVDEHGPLDGCAEAPASLLGDLLGGDAADKSVHVKKTRAPKRVVIKQPSVKPQAAPPPDWVNRLTRPKRMIATGGLADTKAKPSPASPPKR